MESVVALTFVVELPVEIDLDQVGVFAFGKGDPWRGWTPASMANYVTYPRVLDPGRVPDFRLMFRGATVRAGIPLHAAERAFSDWDPSSSQRHARLRRRLAYVRAIARRWRRRVTVVAVTRFVPEAALPGDTGPAWMREQARDAIRVLNQFLVCYGLEVNDERVSALPVAEFPGVLPTILERGPAPSDLEREGGSFPTLLHDFWPDERRPVSGDALQNAATLFRAAYERETAWFEVLELSHAARREGASGSFASAVLTAGTAVELLVRTTVREVGTAAGHSPAEISNLQSAGFRNLVSVHLSRLLRREINIDDPTDPWGVWWQSGYRLRNRVAHEGYRPSETESLDAIRATMDVIASVGTNLESHDELRDLAFGLPTATEWSV